jgi:predicted nucleic acid-binding protein
MPFVVIYDACVLFPAPLRDLLIRVALTGMVRARWSDAILAECFASIASQRPDLKPEALARTRELMRLAVADCIVTGHEQLIKGLALPDPNDRHVLAAAIRAGAQAIITSNVKDFPSLALAKYGLEAVHPDDFVLDLIDLAPVTIADVVRAQASDLKNPPRTLAELLDTLSGNGLVQSVARLRELYDRPTGGT